MRKLKISRNIYMITFVYIPLNIYNTYKTVKLLEHKVLVTFMENWMYSYLI